MIGPLDPWFGAWHDPACRMKLLRSPLSCWLVGAALLMDMGCATVRYPEISKIPVRQFNFGLQEGLVLARLIEFSPASYNNPRYYYFITDKPLMRDHQIILPQGSQVVGVQPNPRNRLMFDLKFVRPQGGSHWTRAEGVANVDAPSGTEVTLAFSSLSLPRTN